MKLRQEESILGPERIMKVRGGTDVPAVGGSTITVEKARIILGSDSEGMSDDQIQKLLDLLNWLCNSVRDKKYG